MIDIRSEILKPRETPREKVTLEDGVELWVYGMTGGQAAQHQSYVLSDKGQINRSRLMRQDALLVVLTARDESGAALFTRDDIDDLLNLPATYLKPALDAANRLSGLRTVDDMVKNSDATDTDD